MPSSDESEPAVLHALLRSIAATEPKAWYPREHSQISGVERNALDEPLNQLRVAGLVRMTDWEAERGQGYLLTSDGQRALRDPRRLTPRRLQPPAPARPRFRDVTVDAPVTRLLVAAQVATFLVGCYQTVQQGMDIGPYLTFGYGTITAELGTSSGAIHAGAWWTLLTYAFVHGGLAHLTLNVIGHLFDVSFAERMWGHARLAVIYFASILAGGVGSVLAHSRGLTVGSSGGWCGVVAALAVLVAARRDRLSAAARQAWFRSFLRVAVLVTTISLLPGVSWGGHLGGAIGGAFAAGSLLLTVNRNRWIASAAWLAALAGPVAAAAGLVYWLTGAGPPV